jgi:hypothetical protein
LPYLFTLSPNPRKHGRIRISNNMTGTELNMNPETMNPETSLMCYGT